MPDPRKLLEKTLGREALLLTVPILALIAFGFVSLRWEKRAQEEELRARCLALADPLRRDLFMRLAKAGYLIGEILPGDINAVPTPAETSDSQTKFTKATINLSWEIPVPFPKLVFLSVHLQPFAWFALKKTPSVLTN